MTNELRAALAKAGLHGKLADAAIGVMQVHLVRTPADDIIDAAMAAYNRAPIDDKAHVTVNQRTAMESALEVALRALATKEVI